MAWSTIFALLFVTVGPIRPSMAFFALGRTTEPKLRQQIAFKAVWVAALILLLVALGGAAILGNWEVRIESLLIAGGVLLLLPAIQIVLSEDAPTPPNTSPPPLTKDFAVYPLAAPTIATPHGVVAIIAIEATLPRQTWDEFAMFCALIVGVMALNFVFLAFADRIYAKVPPLVLKLIVRVLGVLLAALAVQFMIFGLDGLGLIPNPGVDVQS